MFLTTKSMHNIQLIKRFYVFVMRLDIFNIDFLLASSRSKSRSHSRFSCPLTHYIIISRRCTHHCLCNQTSMQYGSSILPLYSIPSSHCIPWWFSINHIAWCLPALVRPTPRYGASKNIVRKFESIFESNKFLNDKMSSNDKRSTNIGTDMIVSSRRLRSTSMHCRFLYHFQGKEWCHT